MITYKKASTDEVNAEIDKHKREVLDVKFKAIQAFYFKSILGLSISKEKQLFG